MWWKEGVVEGGCGGVWKKSVGVEGVWKGMWKGRCSVGGEGVSGKGVGGVYVEGKGVVEEDVGGRMWRVSGGGCGKEKV